MAATPNVTPRTTGSPASSVARPAGASTATRWCCALGATRLALLDREVADPDRPLVNTRWHVITIISGETASSVAADAIATLSFAADGRVTVDTSCNLGSASYRREGTIVVLGALTLDTAVCAADHAALEDALVQLFDARRISSKVEADVLMLRTPSADGVDLRATAG